MKSQIIAAVVIVIVNLILNQETLAQTVKTPNPAVIDAAAIEKLLQTQIEKQSYVGASIAVLHQGEIVFAKAFGRRSLETGAPVETDTIFDVGSITKQFTAAAILLLAEDGKLSVTDKVSAYFPELMRADEITLLDLMNHTSGYRDYTARRFAYRRLIPEAVPEKIIAAYAGSALDFAPGTKWSYSNTNYMILARVVERASGEKFQDFLARRFFKPLGMKNTFYPPRANAERLAAGYSSYAFSEPEAAEAVGVNWTFGAGGLLSTAPDLLKWNLALMDGKVLKPASVRLMTLPRRLADGSPTDYGCGLIISVDRNGSANWGHGGSTEGFLAESLLIPATRSAIVVLSNTDYVLPGSILFGKLAPALSAAAKSADNAPSEKSPAPAHAAPPKVAGLPAAEAARKLFDEMRTGKLDRAGLSDDFSFYLNEKRLRKAAEKLKAFGEPTAFRLIGATELGGIEASFIEIVFPDSSIKLSMARALDGKIEEFTFRK